MKKINILYVDDEMLFIRTVKRVLKYSSEWHDKIEIIAAYHHHDALLKVKNDGSSFDAVILDYRLEPDSAPEDEINGEKLASQLKEFPRCQNSLFYLVSATDKTEKRLKQIKKEDSIFFELSLNKGCDDLRKELYDVFDNVYLNKLKEFSGSGCQFTGDDKVRRELRSEINEYLQDNKSLLLCGSRKDIEALLKDIEEKKFIQFKPSKECYIVDLTDPECHFENTIKLIKSNSKKYFVIVFYKFDKLESKIQQRLMEWINTIDIPVILTCNNIQRCKNLNMKPICKNANIPHLYEIQEYKELKDSIAL